MKLRSLVLLGLVGGLGLTACGSDDDSKGGSGGSSGSGGSGTGGSSTGGSTSGGSGGMGTGGMAGMGTGGMAGMGTGGMAGMGTGGSGTGGSGTGGSATGGTGGSSGMTADAFCASYETHCGFGGTHYASSAECKSKYTAFPAVQQACVVTHLGLATTKTSEHCDHATGIGPCVAGG